MKNRIIFLTTLFIFITFLFIMVIKINFKDSILKTYDSIVYIEAYDNDTISSGMGIVYKIENNKNYIITNYHIIMGYFNIDVYNKNKVKTIGNIVNYDEKNDIAIIEINDVLNLKECKFADSLNKKDKVYALSITNGIENINYKEGNIIEIITIQELDADYSVIKTNINIDYGDSGGPLLNNKGEVIGINFMRNELSNESLTIPYSFIIDYTNSKFINPDKISLGVAFVDSKNIEILNKYDIEISNVSGVVVLNIDNNGIGYKYGLKKGDIITEFGDSIINNINDLKEAMSSIEKDSIVLIKFYRDKEFHTVQVKF